MKKILAVLAILLVLAIAGYAAVGYAHATGKPVNSYIDNIYAIVSDFISDTISLIGFHTEPTYYHYTVTVVDGIGNPMPNVMVKFTDGNGDTMTRVTDNEGVATLKNVIFEAYQVNLEKGFSNAIITKADYTLTSDDCSLKVIVRNEDQSVDIYGEVADGAYASSVGVDSYTISCLAGQTSYYVFTTTVSGVYKVSISSMDDAMTVAYLGNPMFVQSTHRGDGEYDGKSFELVVQDSLTPYVLGVAATENTDATLTIERIGDAPVDPQFAPWTEVDATGATFEKCDTTGKTLVDVPIADSEFKAILGDDGLYYTADGKLIYIRITTAAPHGSLNESFEFVPALNGSLALLAGHVDSNIGVNIGGYVYDEEGNFVNKYRYNNMIKTYMELVDSTYGVVPLTEELAECVKLHGEFNGWWDSEGNGYIFDGVEIDPDNAWLFLCMIEE